VDPRAELATHELHEERSKTSSAAGIIQSGISSVPISAGSAGSLLLLHPRARRAHSQFAHPRNYSHAFGHTDGLARIQRVK
jgi:hypothetical protein